MISLLLGNQRIGWVVGDSDVLLFIIIIIIKAINGDTDLNFVNSFRTRTLHASHFAPWIHLSLYTFFLFSYLLDFFRVSCYSAYIVNFPLNRWLQINIEFIRDICMTAYEYQVYWNTLSIPIICVWKHVVISLVLFHLLYAVCHTGGVLLCFAGQNEFSWNALAQ